MKGQCTWLNKLSLNPLFLCKLYMRISNACTFLFFIRFSLMQLWNDCKYMYKQLCVGEIWYKKSVTHLWIERELPVQLKGYRLHMEQNVAFFYKIIKSVPYRKPIINKYILWLSNTIVPDCDRTHDWVHEWINHVEWLHCVVKR